ncbi:MAG: uroporphyrin-3 C-methyltransferase [Hydrogenophaga sp.]|jgi:uroporphyrin-3 C-methyltransferase
MSDTQPTPTPNADESGKSAAPTPSAPAEPRSSAAAPPMPPAASTFGSHAALLLALISLVVAALSLAVGVWLWQKLGQTQQEMARRSQDNVVQVDQASKVSAQAEALTKELAARLTVAEVRLSEVSLQRSQLEELMLSLSRSRDDNLVQDLESALRLGQQQSQLTGSVAPLLAALQAADQRIDRAAQPRLNPVQRAIQRDIERVRGAAVADVPSVVLRLDELARLVDTWPMANQVGPMVAVVSSVAVAAVGSSPAAKTDTPVTAQSTIPGGETRTYAASEKPENAPALAPANTQEPAPVTGWMADWRERWDRVWHDVVRASRDLVRVSRIDQPEAALLAPEQAYFLRENLKLKLLNARLGLLARQPASALADLVSAEAALARYFNTEAPAVISARAALTQLLEELRLVELPRPDESLAALTTAAGGR